MAIVLGARELTASFGVRPLFDGVSFTVEDGDRIGLIGPNGAGKSTLLKLLAGVMAPDGGEVVRRDRLAVGYLPQVPEFAAGDTIRTAVHAGFTRPGKPAAELDWETEAKVDDLMARLGLVGAAQGGDTPVAVLSGGWQKRVALARALVIDPDLVLLDEPTNHLDVESILWLERFLAGARFATITITHDRLFLQRVATRILELDRRNAGGLIDVRGDYATYVERKAEAMANQERREDVLRNTLRRETEWLRRGPPARSTKQQARIKRAGTLAEEVGALGERNRTRDVTLDFGSSGKKPRRLIEAKEIAKSYDGRPVFTDIDLSITPGTRLGLLGPNGCGKSTLLRVLIGTEEPSAGQVTRADSLQVAWFEQDRGSLDPNRSLADTVCPDGDYVDFRGARMHRRGYLERFLFRQEQYDLPVGRLSGGEQARLLIARLMLRPANLLVLDEPTNDLDLPTLGVLEEALTSFDGAVLLVTHDRYFLDQVATKILAFHTKPGEQGQVTDFSDLSQWEAWHPAQAAAAERAARSAGTADAMGGATGGGERRPKKLGFKDQRDRDTIEARITAAEEKLQALETECALPEVAVDAKRLMALLAEIETQRAAVDALYARWTELEALATGGA